MENIEFVPLGLGDVEGESTMIEVSPANAGMNRMVATATKVAEAAPATEGAQAPEAAQAADGTQAPGTTVRVTTLDGFLGERRVESRDAPASAESAHSADTVLAVDWIKIDVEGYEAHVLRGAAATIERCRPGLFIEVDDVNLRAQGDSASGLLKWVEAAGYQVSDTATRRPMASGSPLEGCHFDALCAHRERAKEG